MRRFNHPSLGLVFLALFTLQAPAQPPTPAPVPNPNPPVLLSENQAFALYNRVQTVAPSTKRGLTAQERRRVLVGAMNHPIARITLIDPRNPANVYDHPKGQVGFCFGRSMATNLIARQMGLREEDTANLFILGKLDQRAEPVENPEWRFHVTTLVKGTDTKWYAADPIMDPSLDPDQECTGGREWTAGTPLLAEEWVCIVKRTWDKRNEAYLYLTSSRTVVPDITKDAAGRTGRHVIELNFDPSRTAGFPQTTIGEYTVYAPDRERQIGYFRGTLTDNADQRFLFNSITVPGLGFVSYRNFFAHLLQDFERRAQPRRGPAPRSLNESIAAAALAPSDEDDPMEIRDRLAPGNLGSPKLQAR